MKTSVCRDGTLKNQPNKMGTTPQHIYTIPTSCAILPTTHNKKLSTHSLNEHGTQHCSLHSLPHERQSIPDSAAFSSNKISQHYLKLPTYHAYPGLLTVSAYKTDHTCHAQQQLYICYKVSFIPTKCFIRKKLIFRLLILQSSSEHTYTAVFCACCVCSDEDCRIAVETSA